MRIVWCARKYLDTSLDSATWTRMVHELVRDGHDVQLLTGYRRTRPDFGLGERIRYVDSVKTPGLNALTFLLSASRMLRDLVSCGAADVVILDHFTVWAAIPVIRRSRAASIGVRFVLDVRTLPVETGRRLRDAVERYVFARSLRVAARWCDGYTAITEPLAMLMSSQMGVPVGSVGIWTSGVDVDAFDPERCSGANAVEPFTVMYHGALLASRGVFEAAAAMGVVRDRGFKNIRLRLVGSGLDAQKLDEYVRANALSDVVSVEPPVAAEEVPSVVCGAHVGLLPFPDLECWRVSSPLKLLEYLSMSRPVIVTPLRCNRDVLRDSPFAVWASGSTVDELADAIIAACVNRVDLSDSAADGARALVLERYTWRSQAERLIEYLQSLRG